MKPARRLSVIIHVQHLSGVGHYVRSREIARALVAAGHRVHLTDGGRPVPQRAIPGLRELELPRLSRADGRLISLEPGRTVATAFAERWRRLSKLVETLRPDVLLIEHYPFSKWEFGTEIDRLITLVRSLQPRARVLCSLRDIAPKTDQENCSPAMYGRTVLGRLHRDFDAILVHGDPQLTRLHEHFPDANQLRLPVIYTGIVSTKLVEKVALPVTHEGAPYVVASAGGGVDAVRLLPLCRDAWIRLQQEGALRGWKLRLFTGLATDAAELPNLAGPPPPPSIEILPFCADYPTWLRQAELSISCAGYNTIANLLEFRRRGILVPNPKMSDQIRRARCLAERGLASLLPSERVDATQLANLILRQLAQPQPKHDLALDGADRTREIIEQFVQ